MTSEPMMNFLWLQGRQRVRGAPRVTTKHHATLGSLGTTENVPKTADSFHRIETTKVAKAPAENHGWSKRSAKTRERLQPIGADSTTVTADENLNPKVTENEVVKQTVPPLINNEKTRIASGTTKDGKKQETEGEKQDEINEGQFLPPIK